ncbi:GTPase-associated system all-helical protein GASH [Bradyrhizobium diazoefficiens]|uniref:GTPase-associated system all-helical protein GASH n=1 Tax=Bradyrhizobium diazoefficiens TaxID=1355477 RepID=UPI00271482DA|nr:GTPase-associated system all-helical protein GASH [Bradyrhizobium diazoefficiens]WLB42306.1 GTPase-associated system all-helical protein GASH [Bradyrhizobium diazoefficiens]
MAEEGVLPMRGEFPRWYRAVDVGENRARLDARWKGVSSLVDAADVGIIDTMLAVLVKTRTQPDAETMAKVRGHFKSADDLFEMSNNDGELEVLCGAVLATLLERNDDVSAQAALATSIALFAGARRTNFPYDFEAASEAAIARISEQRRTRPVVPRLSQVGRFGVDSETIEKLKQGVTHELVVAAVNVVATQTYVAVGDMTAKANDAILAIEDFAAIQDEELQMLWWLFGGRSRKLDLPFADVPVDAQPIILASELADATKFMPGPESVKPILSRAGLKEHKTTGVASAVNACDVALLREFVKGIEPSPLVNPLHFAIHRKLEAGDNTSWAANWSAVTGIGADAALPCIELGNLFYRERLGLKFGG